VTYRPRRACKSCRRDRDDCGGVSRTGLCGPCGEAIMAANARDLRAHRGDWWLHYLEGLTAGVARLWGETQIPASLADEPLADTTPAGDPPDAGTPVERWQAAACHPSARMP